ncbi:MAG TPA: hypothetical protein VHZ81_00550 [Galbitalea sp.]|jgi:hypothetical protein|nr:hypothetical protein [Galbitalea sp.]
MTPWITAGAICLVVIVAAVVTIVRLLAMSPDAEGADLEDIDADTDDWAWRSPADAR